MTRENDGAASDPMQAFDQGRAMIADSAAAVADRLLEAGAHKIDALFGEGFARAHPELLGHYLGAAARIFEGDMASVAASMEDTDDDDDLFDDIDLTRS